MFKVYLLNKKIKRCTALTVSIVQAGLSIIFHWQKTLKDPTELRKSVKRILEVIVGLLKDRISASDEHASKKCRVEAKIKKEL